MGRYNIYRNKDYAKKIANDTKGQFLDTEFKDDFGSYWIVIWRDNTIK